MAYQYDRFYPETPRFLAFADPELAFNSGRRTETGTPRVFADMPPTDRDEPMCFAPGASHAFGEKICGHLLVPLARMEEREFPDGEHKSRPLSAVRERDVYVISSLHADERHSVNDKLCRLLLFLGALRDASARRITAIVPYLCYARKDQRSKPRDPVATRYVARWFESVGTDRLVTLDVHNIAAFENAFRIPVENISAASLFVTHFTETLRGRKLTVVSPDVGGVKRAEAFREALQRAIGEPVTMAFVEKYRSADRLSGGTLVGEVAGRVAIIFDDLISSGGTMAAAAVACRAAGAVAVHAAATHGVFTSTVGDAIANSALDRIAVTDTVPGRRFGAETAIVAKLDVLSAAQLIADVIRQLHTGQPPSALPENADQAFASCR